MRSTFVCATLISLALSPSLARAQEPPQQGQQEDLQKLSQDPKQWVMAQHDYANTRFSPLDQISTSTVGKLQVAWTFSVGRARGQEAAPLIIGDTMPVPE